MYPTTKLDRAVDAAIARENADPQGLPDDILAGMERDIRANPEKYPAITAIFKEMDAR
jgi:hypothetical protein